MVQRVYSAIGGVPGVGGIPELQGWQVAKWLSSALLLLLLLLLLQRSMEHKRAGYFTLSFVFASFFSYFLLFLGFFVWYIFFNFRVELASRARWRAATECGITPRRQPTHLLGPLVDDHLIYCNITHTRTIKRAAETVNGELKRGEKNVGRPALSRCAARAPASAIFLSNFGGSETIGPRINRTNWVLELARTNVRISLAKRNGHEIAVVFELTSIGGRIHKHVNYPFP